MSVKIERGIWSTIWVPKIASTAFADSTLIMVSTGGFAGPATSAAGAAGTPVIGVYHGGALASSDATNTLIPVLVPQSNDCVVRADTASTITQANVGSAFDMTNSTTVNQASQTNKAVTLVSVVATTQGLFALNKQLENAA